MKKILIIQLLLLLSFFSFSQKKTDSLTVKNGIVIAPPKKDTVLSFQGRSPRKAAIYSAVLPGLGQIYNKKYWKVPIAWAAVGIPAALFFYNLKEYRKIQFAYTTLNNKDSANFGNVAPDLQPFIERNDITGLRTNRNTFRQNVDYSVLFFIILWGFNVVDAAVDAHLSAFNVNEDLTLKIKPILQPGRAGIGLVLAFK